MSAVRDVVLKARADEIARLFSTEFVGRDRRTSDVPRLDALIAELTAILAALSGPTDSQRALLDRLGTERRAILAELRRAPILDDEIFVSEPGARANLYTRLHSRAFHANVGHLDLVLLYEIVDGLERAHSDLIARTPAKPARWMRENLQIVRDALATTRGQQVTLLETWRECSAEQRGGEVMGLISDELAIVAREEDIHPSALRRPARLLNLAAALRRLADTVRDEPALTAEQRALLSAGEEVAKGLDAELRSLEATRRTLGVKGLTELLEQELLDLDEVHRSNFTDLTLASADLHLLGTLVDRAISVGLQTSDLWNATRSKRHDSLAIESRKRVELFRQQELSVQELTARRASVH